MRRKSFFIISAALLPVFIHISLLLFAFFKYGYIPLMRFDIVIHIALLAYILGILLTFKWHEKLLRLTIVAYSFFLGIFVIELYFCFKQHDFYPWPPFLQRNSYVVGDSMPGISGKIKFSINSHGLRGPDVDMTKADITFLVIGGSTAECLYVTDLLSWPWRLQDKLSLKLKKNIFVGNAGKSGDTTLDHIYLLENYKYASEFDWVILLCGINDLGRLLRNDSNYFNKSQQIKEKRIPVNNINVYYRNLHMVNIIKSIFYKYDSNKEYQDGAGLWYVEQRQKRKKALEKNAIKKLPLNLNHALLLYKNNLRVIIEICRSRNQNLILLTQPTMWRSDLPEKLHDLCWQHVGENMAYTTDVLAKLERLYNRSLIDVCKKEKISYVDIASMLPKDESIFYDDCHFNIDGCESVANILTDYMAIRVVQKN
jgi:lysophospholipase L1-like esterase